jgi:hypothetical protein
MNTRAARPCKAMFDTSGEPAPRTLTACLGAAAPLWAAVIDAARKHFPHLVEVWKFAGAKVGWSLRLVDRDRIVVYLTPGEGQFRIGMVLGGKVVAMARAAGLSRAATAVVDAAPRYAEGHGLRFFVASSDDLALASELIALKATVPPRTPRGKTGRGPVLQ